MQKIPAVHMTARIIEGFGLAVNVRKGIAAEVATLKRKPGLAVILVGENPASKIYVGIKRKTCEEVGIYSEERKLPEKTSERELLALIEKLNGDEKIDAILVQMPVPAHISSEKVLSAISVSKDVDGFSPVNIGKLVDGNEEIVPCTPKGIIRMLEEEKIEISGKHAVIVGRSAIVGKPVAMLLLNRDATVSVCHSKTNNLAEITRQADILVVAVGRAGMITADMVKDGAAVIDIGINRVDGKITGDVDFDSVKENAGWITPVPKGVGPMTVAMLLENTMQLYRRHG
jgi:methylenetetrahydrofolate dehydrogenase (NADP+) / methenyltetrahydrofolate cyclohydrolase